MSEGLRAGRQGWGALGIKCSLITRSWQRGENAAVCALCSLCSAPVEISSHCFFCFFFNFPFPLNKLPAVGAHKAALCRGSCDEQRRCERRQLPVGGSGAAPLPPARLLGLAGLGVIKKSVSKQGD